MLFLTENGIQHRDLKALNCFVNRELRVKLGDFGTMRDTRTAVRAQAGGRPGGGDIVTGMGSGVGAGSDDDEEADPMRTRMVVGRRTT